MFSVHSEQRDKQDYPRKGDGAPSMEYIYIISTVSLLPKTNNNIFVDLSLFLVKDKQKEGLLEPML